ARPRDRGGAAGDAQPGAGLVPYESRTRDCDLLQRTAGGRGDRGQHHAAPPAGAVRLAGRAGGMGCAGCDRARPLADRHSDVRGHTMLGGRWPYVVAGIGSTLAVAGYALAPASTAPFWAGMAGAASSLAFILNLGLPALLSPSEVARTSGFMFTVGYGAAFFGPALGGFAWDWSGHFRFALLPMLVGALAMLAFGA